jgi:hypothetical protein
VTAPKPSLRDVEARAAAATPGPWTVVAEQGNPGYTPHYGVSSRGFTFPDVVYAKSDLEGFGNGSRERDANFIAASRTDVPALTAAIRAVLAEMEAAERVGDPYAYLYDLRAAIARHIDLDES